jgi:peptide/nickel transport system substrate-binding protein
MLAVPLWGQVQEKPAGEAAPKPAAPKPKPKPAAPQPPADTLVDGPAFDLVYLRGRSEPLHARVNLPRPIDIATLPSGQMITLQRLAGDAEKGQGIGFPVEKIQRIRFFEEMLLERGDQLMERRDFDAAFDHFARAVRQTPRWPGAQAKLQRALMEQANLMLSANPPDYDGVIARCLQLRDEDRTLTGIPQLLRKACLSRAQALVQTEDYVGARDQVDQLLRAYPGDSEGLRFQKGLQQRAQQLATQGEKALSGSLAQQRDAVRMLATARRIWPALPNIERLMARAKRNYPVLNVAVFDLPGVFEPLNARSITEFQACQLLYDTLVDVNDSGRKFTKGDLLEGSPTESNLGRKLRFQLRRGVRWSDGQPLTAWDVERSLALVCTPTFETYDSERARFLGEVLVEDPFTFSLTLNRPHMQPLSLFTFPILPKHLTAEAPARGSEFSRHPVGSGPFQLGTPDSPEQVKFVPNPEFRGAELGQPGIKELNLQHCVKSSAAVRDLEDGKLQLMTRLDPLEVVRFARLPGQFEVRNYLSNSVYMLALNHRRPPFEDARVRRAILLAIDRPRILQQYFQAAQGGLHHQVVTGPFPQHSPAYDTKAPVQKADRHRAIQLVEEAKRAGKLPPRTITLKYPLGDAASPVEKACSQIAKDLRAIGLDVKTETHIESDLHREVVVENKFDIAFWRYDHRNVLYNIAPLFDPEQVQPGGTNFMGYRDTRLATLFNQLRDEQRPLDLWEIQKQIHRYLYDEVVFVPLWQLDNYIAHTSKLVYRIADPDSDSGTPIRQLPIHPLYLFRKTEGWSLEP